MFPLSHLVPTVRLSQHLFQFVENGILESVLFILNANDLISSAFECVCCSLFRKSKDWTFSNKYRDIATLRDQQAHDKIYVLRNDSAGIVWQRRRTSSSKRIEIELQRKMFIGFVIRMPGRKKGIVTNWEIRGTIEMRKSLCMWRQQEHFATMRRIFNILLMTTNAPPAPRHHHISFDLLRMIGRK